MDPFDKDKRRKKLLIKQKKDSSKEKNKEIKHAFSYNRNEEKFNYRQFLSEKERSDDE